MFGGASNRAPVAAPLLGPGRPFDRTTPASRSPRPGSRAPAVRPSSTACAVFTGREASVEGPRDNELQTVRKELPALGMGSQEEAILVHIYPTGPQMGTRYVIGARPLIIGRGDSCDIHINDSSVSRRHAAVEAS